MKIILILILAVAIYTVGINPETTEFFAPSIAHAVSDEKTTVHPSPVPEPHTEPLTASSNIVQPVVQAPTPVSAPPVQPPVQANNEDVIWARLISAGYTREQTAGIMGNLQQEHHFKTSDVPGGLGIAQWILGRRAALMQRDNYSDINVQIDFLLEELNGGYHVANTAIRSSGLEGSVLAFQNHFERCGTCMTPNRMAYAQQILGRH